MLKARIGVFKLVVLTVRIVVTLLSCGVSMVCRDTYRKQQRDPNRASFSRRMFGTIFDIIIAASCTTVGCNYRCSQTTRRRSP